MANITQINVNGTTYDIKDSNAMSLVSQSTNGDVLTVDANGQAVDSGVALSSKQNVVLSGTTEPASSLGSDGDIYILYVA